MLCADVRRELARKNINVYSIHATAIAQEIGLGRHISIGFTGGILFAC